MQDRQCTVKLIEIMGARNYSASETMEMISATTPIVDFILQNNIQRQNMAFSTQTTPTTNHSVSTPLTAAVSLEEIEDTQTHDIHSQQLELPKKTERRSRITIDMSSFKPCLTEEERQDVASLLQLKNEKAPHQFTQTNMRDSGYYYLAVKKNKYEDHHHLSRNIGTFNCKSLSYITEKQDRLTWTTSTAAEWSEYYFLLISEKGYNQWLENHHKKSHSISRIDINSFKPCLTEAERQHVALIFQLNNEKKSLLHNHTDTKHSYYYAKILKIVYRDHGQFVTQLKYFNHSYLYNIRSKADKLTWTTSTAAEWSEYYFLLISEKGYNEWLEENHHRKMQPKNHLSETSTTHHAPMNEPTVLSSANSPLSFFTPTQETTTSKRTQDVVIDEHTAQQTPALHKKKRMKL